MDEQSAWSRFVSTGSVSDYLNYINAKNQNFNKYSGENSYANQNGWVDNTGEKFI